MFFTRKKNQKRLWGLRVNTSDRASSSPEPQRNQHHHLHHQQHQHHQTTSHHQRQQPHHLPQHHHHQQQQQQQQRHQLAAFTCENPPCYHQQQQQLPTPHQPISNAVLAAAQPATRGRKSTGDAADGGSGGLGFHMATAFMNCCGGGGGGSASTESTDHPSELAGSPMDTTTLTTDHRLTGTMTSPSPAPAPAPCHPDQWPPTARSSPDQGGSIDSPTHLYALFCALVKRLKESQIVTLCQALEQPTADGGPATNCVLVPRDAVPGEPDGPHVLACRLWRWPDVRCADELRRLPTCPSAWDPVYECCNPSHWSRQMLEETPPPPYCLFAMDRLKPEDLAPSEERLKDFSRYPGGSFVTEGEDSLPSAIENDGWCQLAYWELSQRVGQLFPVAGAAINVFAEQPRADGLCLATLASQRRSATPESVLKARSKIGLGVTLSREADGVWLYNRSAAPVFVHSPTLNDLESRSVLVYRVPPGHCLRAFDHEKAASELNALSTYMSGGVGCGGGPPTGPIDIYSVRISFAKGWGPKYQRQEVTACPCWLEVHLSRCR